jgi:hypothetical protein
MSKAYPDTEAKTPSARDESRPIVDYGLLADSNSAASSTERAAGATGTIATPGSAIVLGNFRQAFSHIGLITAAWEIDMARGRGS